VVVSPVLPIQALHAADKELTVDFAGWSTIWDYASLNASKADRLLCMVRASHSPSVSDECSG
jgi:hypothetical protein